MAMCGLETRRKKKNPSLTEEAPISNRVRKRYARIFPKRDNITARETNDGPSRVKISEQHNGERKGNRRIGTRELINRRGLCGKPGKKKRARAGFEGNRITGRRTDHRIGKTFTKGQKKTENIQKDCSPKTWLAKERLRLLEGRNGSLERRPRSEGKFNVV